MKTDLPRKIRRQVERHLAKQKRKDLVKQHNLNYDAEKFFETDEGKEYYQELLKIYVEQQNNI